MKRKVILSAISIAILTIFGLSIYRLHSWQCARVKVKTLENGLKLYQDCNWEGAASNLGRYLAFCPNDLNILLKYADAQLHIRPAKQDNLQQAVAAYRKVIRADKTNKTAAFRLSNLYLQINAPSEAENVTARYLQFKNDVDIKNLLAISMIKQRKFNEAAYLIKEIIKKNPQEILPYELIAGLAEQNADNLYGDPKYWLNLCIENNPKSPGALILRASFYIRKNKQSDALSDLLNAETLGSTDPNVHIELAIQYIRIDLFFKAKEHLCMAEFENPSIPAIWEARAQMAFQEESKTNMLQVAENAMRFLKNNPWDFMPIAAELMIKGENLKKGCEYIERLKVKGVNPAAVKWLEGLVAKAQARDYDSIRMWNIALKMGYNTEKITPELIDAFLRVGDCESALMELRKRITEQPENYNWHLQLARLTFQQNIYTEALQHSEKAISIMPGMLDPLLIKMKVKIIQIQNNDNSSKCEDLKNIIVELSNFADVNSGYSEIELLKFTCAIECQDLENAERILNELERIHTNKLIIGAAHVDLLLSKHMTDEAEHRLSELIDQFPQEISPVAYLSDILSKSGKYEQNESILVQALGRIENPQSKRQLTLMLADVYEHTNDIEKERLFLTDMINKLPEDIPLRIKLIDLYLKNKEYVKAQDIIEKIKKIEGIDGRQWKYQQARLWINDKFFETQYQQIKSLLKQNITDNSYDIASQMLLASAYEKASEDQMAIIMYRAVLDHRPYNINIKTHIIDALFRLKEYDTADVLLNEVIKQEYVNGEILKLNLRKLLRQNKITEAIQFLETIELSVENRKTVKLLIASLKIKNKEYDIARDMLNEILIQEPDSLKAKSLLVELNIGTKNYMEALNLCNEIIDLNQESIPLLLRAHVNLAIGKIKEAQNDLDRAVSFDPNNPDVWEARGFYYRSIGRFDLAFEDLEKAYQLQLSNIDIVKYMLNALPDINDSFNVWKCQQLLKHALVNHPKDPELLWYKARLLIAENKASSLSHAENILTDVTKDNPRFSFGWSLLTELYLNLDESGRAMDTILQGLKYCPNDKTLLLLKAKIEILSSPEIALSTLEHLNKCIPNDIDIITLLSDTYILTKQNQKGIQLLWEYELKCPNMQKEKIGAVLAIALYRSGYIDEAWQKIQELYRIDQNSLDVSIAKCEIFYYQHDWEKLNNEFNNILLSHPESVERCLDKIRNFLTSKNQPQPWVAESLLKKILKYRPDYCPAIQLIAINFHKREKFDEATAFYQKLLESDPNNKIAINNLSWILCENYKQYEKALELAQHGLKIYPDYASLTDTRGLIHYRLGEFKKASQDFYESLNLNDKNSPSYVISLFHLGKTMNKMGYPEKAAVYLEKAIELNQIQEGLTKNEVKEAQNILTFISNESYASDTDK